METTKEELVARLNPLNMVGVDNDAELKRLVEEKAQEHDPKKQEERKRVDDPKAQKEYLFSLDYVDASGKHWMGSFISKIPSIQERQHIGILRAQLSGGLLHGSLDPLTEELNLIIATLTFSLGKDRPDWAKNLRELEDFGIIQAIYEEVASHEAFFLGWGKNQSVGKGESE